MLCFYGTLFGCELDISNSKPRSRTKYHLPYGRLRVFILADCYSYNLATLFKVVCQLLLVCRKVDIFYEHATGIGVILWDCLAVLPIVSRVGL